MITFGLDVGGTKVLGVAVDDAEPGTVVGEHRIATPGGGRGLVEALAGLTGTLAAEAGEPAAIGIGVPGLVDRRGVLHVGAHLRHLSDVPLGERLTAATGHPCTADNDANCHALAEARSGAAAGGADVLLVTLGTGVGGGLVMGGRLVHGANGFAGELGHTIVDPTGPPCPCGRHGCWERYASGTGLARLAREAAEGGRLDAVVELAGGIAELRGEHVTAAARAGDPGSVELFDRFAWWVALGLANAANALDPEAIVVGGGLVEAADLLLPPVRTHFGQLVMAGDIRPAIPIVAAHHGERAGAIGAALLAAEETASQGP